MTNDNQMGLNRNKKTKWGALLGVVGGVLVLLGAALWVSSLPFVPFLFAAGAIFYAVSHFLEMGADKADFVLRRLYRQRKFSAVMLLLAALLMVVCRNGFVYWMGYPVMPNAWLIPFLVFVVFETYTTFRISHIEKDTKK